MVKSTVDCTFERDVDRSVRLGNTLSLRDLSIEDRLAVTELGSSEREVKLDWTASTCSLRYATQAAPTSMPIIPTKSNNLAP